MVWILGNKISVLANNFLRAVDKFSERCENNFKEKKLGFGSFRKLDIWLGIEEKEPFNFIGQHLKAWPGP